MADLKKQTNNEDMKKFWESAEEAAKEVAGWPAWKRLEQESSVFSDPPGSPRTASTRAAPSPRSCAFSRLVVLSHGFVLL